MGSDSKLNTRQIEEIYDLFRPVEGINTVYYGKIRNGKTYAATADILDLLKAGEIVYANWQIEFDGYDQRDSFWVVFFKFLAGKKLFFNFKAENLHYLDTTTEEFIKDINKLVGVHLFIDEGQWIFNSHLKSDDVDKRRLILEGGHYCRSLNVITQRPSNILKDVRSQIHIWYKCQKVFHAGKLIRFVRYSIEDTDPNNDLPIEPEDHDKTPPLKAYWGSKRIYKAYNTHARRSSDAVIPEHQYEVYSLTGWETLKLLFSKIPLPKRRKRPKRMRGRAAAGDKNKRPNWKLQDIKKVG
jgi:hypothetical protein